MRAILLDKNKHCPIIRGFSVSAHTGPAIIPRGDYP